MSIGNFYSVGIGNVGSYQVSGTPWLKTFYNVAPTTQQHVVFQKVAKKIKIKNLSPSGQIKIGFASIASGNPVYLSHCITLTPNQEFTFNCKTKEIFIYAESAQQNFQVEATLTQIPANAMYLLEGEGIDE